MEINHRSGRVAYRYFEDAVAFFLEHLGFEIAADRSESMAVVRQPGTGFNIQLIGGGSRHVVPWEMKQFSHIGFVSDRPVEDVDAMCRWCEQRSIATETGQWSKNELWIDLPEVFLDFGIEVMDRQVLLDYNYKFPASS